MKTGLGGHSDFVCNQFFLKSTKRVMYHPDGLLLSFGPDDSLMIQEKTFTYNLSDFEAIKSIEVMPGLETTPSTRALFVTRVSKSTDLTMTALYGFDKDYPFLILPTKHCLRDFAIGDLIAVHPDNYNTRSKKVRLTVSSYDNPRVYLQAIEDEKTKNKQIYTSSLTNIKSQYVDLFMKGKLDELMYDNIVIQKGGTIAFNNIVMEITEKNVLEVFIRNLISGRYIVNDSFVSSVLTSIGKATVNGVPLTFEKRTSTEGENGVAAERSYINDHRVNNDEARTALDTVLCYTGNAKGYEDYLSGVSKISLFRQGFIRNGIPFTVDSYSGIFATASKELNKELEGYELDFGGSTDSIAYTCSLPFRKVGGKVPDIFIFDKWRKVDKFDSLVKFCENSHVPNRSSDLGRLELSSDFFTAFSAHYPQFKVSSGTQARYSDNVQIKAFQSLMSKLYVVDYCLRAEDKIFPTPWLQPANTGHYNYYRSFVAPDKAMATEMLALYEASMGMFKASSNDRLKAIVRSKLLLEDTIKQHNIKVIKNKQGKIHMFAVQGSSGTIYKVTTSGKVHHEVDGRDEYVCIAYDGSKTIVGFDYTVSVLTALANDKHTAEKIHTIQRFIKK